MLGLVPAVYPTINPRPERATRARLASVLRGWVAPERRGPGSARDPPWLGRGPPEVLATEAAGMSKRDLTKRIEELAKDDPTGSAVRRSIQAMTVAMTRAVRRPRDRGRSVLTPRGGSRPLRATPSQHHWSRLVSAQRGSPMWSRKSWAISR